MKTLKGTFHPKLRAVPFQIKYLQNIPELQIAKCNLGSWDPFVAKDK